MRSQTATVLSLRLNDPGNASNADSSSPTLVIPSTGDKIDYIMQRAKAFESFCLRFALRRLTKSHLSLSSQRGSNDLQYTNTWLNQSPLLKAHKSIAEQESFRLSNAASMKRHSSSPVPYLEIPHVLAQILLDLHLDIVFRNTVLSESLASETFSQLQPKRELSC
jgi:hypothetical protein